MFLFFQSKFQKHQAFEAEVSANQERVLETINLAEGKMIFFKRELLLLSQIWRCVEVVTFITVDEILCSDWPIKIFSTGSLLHGIRHFSVL